MWSGCIESKAFSYLGSPPYYIVSLLLNVKMMGIRLDYVGNKVTRLLYRSYSEIMDLLFLLNIMWIYLIS